MSHGGGEVRKVPKNGPLNVFPGSPCKIRSFDAGSLSDCEKICSASGVKTKNGVAYLDDEATCICGPLGQLFN